jgi:GTPase SAR1 family protein
METLSKADITEKLSAKNHLGNGTVGLVPFEVVTDGDSNLGSVLKQSFDPIRDLQPKSEFFEGSVSGISPCSESNLFILRASNIPQIEIISSKIFVIEGPLNSESFLRRLPYLFYNLAERTRQEDFGLITVHGAAVSKEGRGILILGDKGSGKTSLMLALCLAQGCQMVGNDTIVTGGKESLVIAAGSKRINVRLPVSRKLNLPVERTEKNNGIDYEIKSTFLPEDLGIGIASRTIPLSGIVRINLHSDNPEYVISDITSRETEALRLSENFSRYIRGIPTPIELTGEGIHGYFPDLDTPSLAEFRNNLVNAILNNTPYFYVAGREPTRTAQKLVISLNQL